MSLPLRDRQRHTYADYLSWSDDVRYELIDGLAYLMSPAPSPTHQRLVGELFYQTRASLQGARCEVFVAPLDVRLPSAGEEDQDVTTVLQPDLFVTCDPSRVDERGLRGAPDWVVEILSPSTAGHDQIRKLGAYEKAGVPEVWIVHPTDRTVAVYRLVDGAYGRATITELEGITPVGAVPGMTIDWNRVVERLD